MIAPGKPAALLLEIFRSFRPNQWTKNLVVFAAYIFAFGDRTQSLVTGSFLLVFEAFVIFCMASSSIYLLNDIVDRENDRNHPLKRYRPVAAGSVPVPAAAILSVVLGGSGLVTAFVLNFFFGLLILAYLCLQAAYSLWLKHTALVDVFIIATGFIFRAAAGGIVIHAPLSPWFLLCAFLLALFLALCKRRHEKLLMENLANTRPSLDQYDSKLLDQLIAIVSASVIVCYSIYTLWPDTTRKFGTYWLSLTIPFVIFGIFRYLDLVYRKEGGGRPEKVLLTDLPVIVILLLYSLTLLVIFLLAKPM